MLVGLIGIGFTVLVIIAAIILVYALYIYADVFLVTCYDIRETRNGIKELVKAINSFNSLADCFNEVVLDKPQEETAVEVESVVMEAETTTDAIAIETEKDTSMEVEEEIREYIEEKSKEEQSPFEKYNYGKSENCEEKSCKRCKSSSFLTDLESYIEYNKGFYYCSNVKLDSRSFVPELYRQTEDIRIHVEDDCVCDLFEEEIDVDFDDRR
jgi:hypothetical protein